MANGITDGADRALGTTADASGAPTMIGLLKAILAAGGGGGGGGAVTLADGADVNAGATIDVGVTGDNPGSLSAKLRGISKILASAWDAVNGRLHVAVDTGLITAAVNNFPANQPVSFVAPQHVIVDSGAVVLGAGAAAIGTVALTAGAAAIGTVALTAGAAVIGHVIVDSATIANLDVALSTRLKPADTLAGITTVAAVTAITNALPAGTNNLGKLELLDSAAADLTAAKNAQTSRSLGVTRLIDAGRNARNFMLDLITAAPVAEALASVVQWYGNAAVAATTTPAVVPAGKTLRLTHWKIQYQSLSTVGYAVVRLRANTGGVVALASPLVWSFEAGTGAGATTVAETGAVTTETGEFPEGMEFPAGTGIGFSVAGYGPTGVLTLEGGVRFAVGGYEY